MFDRKPELQPLFLGVFLTLAFLLIIFAGMGVMPSTPARYLPELGFALAFLIGVSLDRILEMMIHLKKNIIQLGLLVLLIGMSLSIIVGREAVMAYDQGVLGLWTGVERGDIWQAREKFGGIYHWWGYGISLGTVWLVYYLKKNAK